ncbi:hypothetical protein HDG37_000568 [Paraburkholderia sp. MM5384-R2]|nr:hypothetical protein [Paraburkholderia sp. MM5384-R2]
MISFDEVAQRFTHRSSARTCHEPGDASGDSGWGATVEANRPVTLGFTYAHCDSLDVSVGKAVGDAPVESASHSPRINARFCYQLN